jgi:hypothetical protein
MAIWQQSDVNIGDWVRDRAGEMGTGQVTRVHSYGCDVAWESGNAHFLGFSWLDKVVAPSYAQEAEEEIGFEISDSGDVLYRGADGD